MSSIHGQKLACKLVDSTVRVGSKTGQNRGGYGKKKDQGPFRGETSGGILIYVCEYYLCKVGPFNFEVPPYKLEKSQTTGTRWSDLGASRTCRLGTGHTAHYQIYASEVCYTSLKLFLLISLISVCFFKKNTSLSSALK